MLRLRRTRQEIRRRSPRLLFPISGTAQNTPLNIQLDAALNHGQQSCAGTNLNVVRMRAEAENRQAVTGGGKLQRFHIITLTKRMFCQDAKEFLPARPFLREVVCPEGYPWLAKNLRIYTRRVVAP